MTNSPTCLWRAQELHLTEPSRDSRGIPTHPKWSPDFPFFMRRSGLKDTEPFLTVRSAQGGGSVKFHRQRQFTCDQRTMLYGIYLAAEGAHAQAKRLEVVANNLANVETPGFRRQLAIFQARPSEEDAEGIRPPTNGDIQMLSGGIRVVETPATFSPGKLKYTGVPTDLAIAGEGFFAVERNGEVLLTRAGSFTLSPAGQLMARVGGKLCPVLSQAGQAIVIDPMLGSWEITTDGVLRQGGMAQPLALVRPTRSGDIIPAGENMYRVDGPIEPVPEAERSVRAGYLEESAVNPTLEMLSLIETSRAIEANLNMLQLQETTLGSLVTRLLRVA